MRYCKQSLILFGLVFWSCQSTLAATWIFTGEIAALDPGLNTDIFVGQEFTISIEFDPEAVDLHEYPQGSSNSHTNDARGRYLGSWISFSSSTFSAMNFGGGAYAPIITVTNDNPWLTTGYDHLDIGTSIQPFDALPEYDRGLVAINMSFVDEDSSIFSDDSLVSTFPVFSDFESAELSMLFSNDYNPGQVAFDAKRVYGTINGVTTVPVPGAIMLYFFAISALVGLKRSLS